MIKANLGKMTLINFMTHALCFAFGYLVCAIIWNRSNNITTGRRASKYGDYNRALDSLYKMRMEKNRIG